MEITILFAQRHATGAVYSEYEITSAGGCKLIKLTIQLTILSALALIDRRGPPNPTTFHGCAETKNGYSIN
jgi:hypothetical protein